MRVEVTGKRLRHQDKRVTHFISSLSHDTRIADKVIKVNIAHLLALYKSSHISKEEFSKLVSFISSFKVKERASEDIFYLIEQEAIEKLSKYAYNFNLGKSRNDQVATCIRMQTREEIIRTINNLSKLQEELLGLSQRYPDLIFPAYTHLQKAQPVTLPYYLMAYFDSLSRNIERLFELYKRVNQLPLGFAALAGSSVRIDREYESSLLGFDTLLKNGIDAVSSRDFVLESLFVLSCIGIDVSRLCEEIMLWTTSEFSYLDVSDEFCATSSIMPQKKNQVVAEVARARAASTLSNFVACFTILKGLPYAYNLDLQEITPYLWDSFDKLNDSVLIIAEAIKNAYFRKEKIYSELKKDYTTATSLAEFLTLKKGVPYRVSYSIVSLIVRNAVKYGLSLQEAISRYIRSASKQIAIKELSLTEEEIINATDEEKVLEQIRTENGANILFVKKELEDRKRVLREEREELVRIESMLQAAFSFMNEEVGRITK